jgi:hypothetical protein
MHLNSAPGRAESFQLRTPSDELGFVATGKDWRRRYRLGVAATQLVDKCARFA